MRQGRHMGSVWTGCYRNGDYIKEIGSQEAKS